jgi:hypothetical protein
MNYPKAKKFERALQHGQGACKQKRVPEMRAFDF